MFLFPIIKKIVIISGKNPMNLKGAERDMQDAEGQ